MHGCEVVMFLFSQLTSWLQSNVQNHLFGEKYAVVGAEDKFLLLHPVSFKTQGTHTQGGGLTNFTDVHVVLYLVEGTCGALGS